MRVASFLISKSKGRKTTKEKKGETYQARPANKKVKQKDIFIIYETKKRGLQQLPLFIN